MVGRSNVVGAHMELVRTFSQLENTQTASQVSQTSWSEQIPNLGDNFDATLKSLLPSTSENNVSEEELFAALVKERIVALKGAEAGVKFDEQFALQKQRYTKADGFVAYEAAGVASLKKLTAEGVISDTEGDQIYSQAFAAAQLDSNAETLWDRRGGGNDPTIAVEALATALASARTKIENLVADATKLTVRSLKSADDGQVATVSSATGQTSTSSTSSIKSYPTGTIKPRGRYVDGTNGFLFKPISSTDGRLAILLPESMAHNVTQVVLKNSKGKVLDRGRSTGYGDMGVREKFAFSKKGGSYPKNLIVEVSLSDGSKVRYKIPDPSQRYD
jgi:hypothetical protein